MNAAHARQRGTSRAPAQAFQVFQAGRRKSRFGLSRMRCGYEARYAHTEVFTEHNHLTLGKPALAHVNVHRLPSQAFQLDYGAAAKLQYFLNRHADAAQLDSNR